jgi:hypothetical protein
MKQLIPALSCVLPDHPLFRRPTHERRSSCTSPGPGNRQVTARRVHFDDCFSARLVIGVGGHSSSLGPSSESVSSVTITLIVMETIASWCRPPFLVAVHSAVERCASPSRRRIGWLLLLFAA